LEVVKAISLMPLQRSCKRLVFLSECTRLNRFEGQDW
jgi:hypothetical protein